MQVWRGVALIYSFRTAHHLPMQNNSSFFINLINKHIDFVYHAAVPQQSVEAKHVTW